MNELEKTKQKSFTSSLKQQAKAYLLVGIRAQCLASTISVLHG